METAYQNFGIFRIKTLKSIPLTLLPDLNKLVDFDRTYIKLGLSQLMGDYNGDGKTDVLLPTKVDGDDWRLLLSTELHFLVEIYLILL